ncbi:MAG: nicotinate (nicotinamide) nucleotide adenylyltransferase [Verrucomicrobia bacterium]|jgi:nicotinate-nucleotide adenylyltransferase|nr:nicotinate (nicotinamide) nucleotide adenylyltransferase [Verrucomicrobiota bacterium]
MRIGIYGGTFNPVHHGHLILARQALEEFKLDRLVFVPAAESPFKIQNHSAPAGDRLAMLRLAIAGEDRFSVDALEIERGGISYSIDTVKMFRNRDPGAELFFLVGEDNADRLTEWHRFEELKKLVYFVVLSRSEDFQSPEYPVVQRRIEISSTEIRNRVANQESITYLVPESVKHYIEQHQLYQGERVSALRS